MCEFGLIGGRGNTNLYLDMISYIRFDIGASSEEIATECPAHVKVLRDTLASTVCCEECQIFMVFGTANGSVRCVCNGDTPAAVPPHVT